MLEGGAISGDECLGKTRSSCSGSLELSMRLWLAGGLYVSLWDLLVSDMIIGFRPSLISVGQATVCYAYSVSDTATTIIPASNRQPSSYSNTCSYGQTCIKASIGIARGSQHTRKQNNSIQASSNEFRYCCSIGRQRRPFIAETHEASLIRVYCVRPSVRL